MSLWVAFGCTLALLGSPWLLMPRRRSGDIKGLVRILWPLNAFYCAFWHRLEVMDADPLPDGGAGDPDQQPHLLHRPHAAPGRDAQAARVPDRQGVIRILAVPAVLPGRRLHPGPSRRQRRRRDARGAPRPGARGGSSRSSPKGRSCRPPDESSARPSPAWRSSPCGRASRSSPPISAGRPRRNEVVSVLPHSVARPGLFRPGDRPFRPDRRRPGRARLVRRGHRRLMAAIRALRDRARKGSEVRRRRRGCRRRWRADLNAVLSRLPGGRPAARRP